MNLLGAALLVSLAATLVQSQYPSEEQNEADENPTNRNHLKPDIQNLLERQVGQEMHASLQYMVMASHFGSETVNRPGFRKFFKKASDEERDHAQKIIDYLSNRGAKLQKLDFKMPPQIDLKSAIDALNHAVNLENTVTDSLMNIHQKATDAKDAHLTHFLEGEFLGEQIESLRKLSGFANNLRAMSHKDKSTSNNLAEYLFDLELQKSE